MKKYKYSRKQAIEIIRRDWNFEIMKNVLLVKSDKHKSPITNTHLKEIKKLDYCPANVMEFELQNKLNEIIDTLNTLINLHKK